MSTKPVRWPPVRVLVCLRCSRPLVAVRAIAVERWPGGLFCSAACVERMDAGFEAAVAALRGATPAAIDRIIEGETK